MPNYEFLGTSPRQGFFMANFKEYLRLRAPSKYVYLDAATTNF